MTTRSSRSLALLTALLLVTPSLSAAAEFRAGDSPSLGASETLTDDLYIVGGSVSSAGPVKGDVVAAGGNALVNGPVSGDVIVAGGSVSVLSEVGDDIRAAGGTVVIQGAVAGDVLAAGGQVQIASSKIGGDASIAGGVVRIDAPIVGDLQIVGGDVRINAPIGGNVDIQAEQVTLGPKAIITGALTYKSPKQAVLEQGAVVRGETVYTKSPDVREAAKLGVFAIFSIWFVAKIFMVFTGALVFAYVFQRFSKTLVREVVERPLPSIGRGIIFAIITPVVSFLLLFTIIGLSFGILGILLYIASIIMATMIVPLVAGSVAAKWLFKTPEYETNVKTVLIGTVLYLVVGLVPVIGGIVLMTAMVLSLGAALTIKMGVIREWR